jgi:hypothetical protein
MQLHLTRTRLGLHARVMRLSLMRPDSGRPPCVRGQPIPRPLHVRVQLGKSIYKLTGEASLRSFFSFFNVFYLFSIPIYVVAYGNLPDLFSLCCFINMRGALYVVAYVNLPDLFSLCCFINMRGAQLPLLVDTAPACEDD